jgi:hypothetical protein
MQRCWKPVRVCDFRVRRPTRDNLGVSTSFSRLLTDGNEYSFGLSLRPRPCTAEFCCSLIYCLKVDTIKAYMRKVPADHSSRVVQGMNCLRDLKN